MDPKTRLNHHKLSNLKIYDENARINTNKTQQGKRIALSDIGNRITHGKVDLKPSTVVRKKATVQKSNRDIIALSDNNLPAYVVDIDALDRNDPLLCSEYICDIYRNMLKQEKKLTLDSNYISRQPVITKGMRTVLLDWLVDVHLRYNFHPESLYLTAFIIDQYLQIAAVSRKKLQLVGIAAFYIAIKYEEIFLASADDLLYLTENTYDISEFIEMEAKILIALDFNLSRPTSLHFLRRISKAASADIEQHTFARYLTEIALIEYGLLCYLPSQIAAASTLVSLKIFNKSWTPTLQYYSSYSEESLRPIAYHIVKLAWKSWTSKYQAVHRKFANKKAFKKNLSHLMRSLNTLTPSTW